MASPGTLRSQQQNTVVSTLLQCNKQYYLFLFTFQQLNVSQNVNTNNNECNLLIFKRQHSPKKPSTKMYVFDFERFNFSKPSSKKCQVSKHSFLALSINTLACG